MEPTPLGAEVADGSGEGPAEQEVRATAVANAAAKKRVVFIAGGKYTPRFCSLIHFFGSDSKIAFNYFEITTDF